MRTPHFDFVRHRRRWAVISGVLVLASLGSLLLRGLDLSIDFEGGTSFLAEQVPAQDVTADGLRQAAEDAGAADVTAQLNLDGDDIVGAVVRTAAIEPGSETETAVREAVRTATGADDVDITFVGPSWGERISRKAVEALIVFLVVVVIYISLRLDFKMAGAAVTALVHDVLITVGVYSLTGFTVSPATVIALLTILGYSLYDTVVVFDRIKENSQALGSPGRRTYGEMVNTSLNEVLWRSVNTSLTSLLPVGGLLFIGSRLLGASTLEDLALALFVGMALGTYSSIFVAGPMLAWWKSQEPDHVRLEERLRHRVEAGDEPEVQTTDDVIESRAPITTDYVRGPGRRKRRR